MKGRWHPFSVALVILMAIGSALMWIGVPLGLVFLASRMADSPQPTMGPYLLIIFGLPIGMSLVGFGLGRLDRIYGRITGTASDSPYRATWLKSMRAEREPAKKRFSVLDTVMVWSVVACGVLMAVWFFAFAGSSLPTQ